MIMMMMMMILMMIITMITGIYDKIYNKISHLSFFWENADAHFIYRSHPTPLVESGDTQHLRTTWLMNSVFVPH